MRLHRHAMRYKKIGVVHPTAPSRGGLLLVGWTVLASIVYALYGVAMLDWMRLKLQVRRNRR
jgi:hypothetical protein